MEMDGYSPHREIVVSDWSRDMILLGGVNSSSKTLDLSNRKSDREIGCPNEMRIMLFLRLFACILWCLARLVESSAFDSTIHTQLFLLASRPFKNCFSARRREVLLWIWTNKHRVLEWYTTGESRKASTAHSLPLQI